MNNLKQRSYRGADHDQWDSHVTVRYYCRVVAPVTAHKERNHGTSVAAVCRCLWNNVGGWRWRWHHKHPVHLRCRPAKAAAHTCRLAMQQQPPPLQHPRLLAVCHRYCLVAPVKLKLLLSLQFEDERSLSCTQARLPADQTLSAWRVTKASAAYTLSSGFFSAIHCNIETAAAVRLKFYADFGKIQWHGHIIHKTSESKHPSHLSTVTIWNRVGNSESNPQRGSSSTSTTIPSRPSGRTAYLTASAVLWSLPLLRSLTSPPPPLQRPNLPTGAVFCSVTI